MEKNEIFLTEEEAREICRNCEHETACRGIKCPIKQIILGLDEYPFEWIK